MNLKDIFTNTNNKNFGKSWLTLIFIIVFIIIAPLYFNNYNNKSAKNLLTSYKQNFNESNYDKAKDDLKAIIELSPSDKKTLQEAENLLAKFDERMQRDIQVKEEEKALKQKQNEAVGQELMESYNTVLSRNTSNSFFNYADYDPKYTGEYYNVRVYVNQYFQSESQFYEYVALCQRTWYMMAGARKEKLVDYNPDFINIDFFDAASGEKIYTWNKNVRRPL